VTKPESIGAMPPEFHYSDDKLSFTAAYLIPALDRLLSRYA
jgi:hypothetical protein